MLYIHPQASFISFSSHSHSHLIQKSHSYTLLWSTAFPTAWRWCHTKFPNPTISFFSGQPRSTFEEVSLKWSEAVEHKSYNVNLQHDPFQYAYRICQLPLKRWCMKECEWAKIQWMNEMQFQASNNSTKGLEWLGARTQTYQQLFRPAI